MTDEVKQATKVYMMGTAWLLLHGEDKTYGEKIPKMITRVEKTEEFLLSNGYTREQLKILLDRTQQFVTMHRDDMTEEQRELYDQLLWGPKTRVEYRDRDIDKE